jgi:hypothetical protein
MNCPICDINVDRLSDRDYGFHLVDCQEKRIAELEAELKAYKFAIENAIIDRTLGGNTPLAQYVAEAIAELNRQAQEEK